MNTPSQSQRKARFASGAHGEDSTIAVRGADAAETAGSTASPSPRCVIPLQATPPQHTLSWEVRHQLDRCRTDRRRQKRGRPFPAEPRSSPRYPRQGALPNGAAWQWIREGVVMEIIGTIVFGAVIGVLARIVLPGKQPYGFIVTILLGIAGALIGYWLWGLLGGGNTFGIDWIRWVISVAAAAILSLGYSAITRRSKTEA